jgi:hypothetical protein
MDFLFRESILSGHLFRKHPDSTGKPSGLVLDGLRIAARYSTSGLVAVRSFLLVTIGVFHSVLSIAHLSASPLEQQEFEQKASVQDVSVTSLLVIDRSGSMFRLPDGTIRPEGSSEPNRWERMLKEAEQIVDLMPLRSDVWICSFNGYTDNREEDEDVFRIREFRLDTAVDRQTIKNFLNNRGRDGVGEPGGGTALYDAMAIAMNKAQQIAQENPGAYVTVYCYTDGIDESSRDFLTLEAVEEKFGDLIVANSRLKWYQFQLDSSQPVQPPRGGETGDASKTPLTLYLSPTKLVLPNPIDQPESTIELQFFADNFARQKIANARANFWFESTGENPIQVTAPPTLLDSGIRNVPLKVENVGDLDPNRRYSGILKIEVESVEQHDIYLNPSQIEISFSQGKQLEILDLQPANESTWAVGQPIQFSLFTSPNTNIRWDFGEDRTATGSPVSFVYQTPGKKEIKVSVKGMGSELPVEEVFELNLIELPISVEMDEYPVFVGQEVRLRGAGSKAFARFEWLINGQTFPAVTDESNEQIQVSLNRRFPFAGDLNIQLLGYTEQAQASGSSGGIDGGVRVIGSPVRTLRVYDVPEIEISSPLPLAAATDVGFKIDLPRPDLYSIEWNLDAGTIPDEQLRLSNRELKGINSPTFRYPQIGTFEVEARVNWKNGERQTFNRTIQVIGEDPVAEPDWTAVTTVSGGRLYPGVTLNLSDNSKGSVSSRTWELVKPDGTVEAYGPNARSVTLTELGVHQLKLTVEGLLNRDTGQRARDSAMLEAKVVPPPPWFAFNCLAAITALGIGTLAWLMLGNSPRYWQVAYAMGEIDPESEDEHPFRTLRKIRPFFHWNFWKKRGRLLVQAISDSAFWRSGKGKDRGIDFLLIDGKPRVRYSATDLPSVSFNTRKLDEHQTLYTWIDRESEDPEDHTFSVILDSNPKRVSRWHSLLMVLIGVIAGLGVLYWFYETYFRI